MVESNFQKKYTFQQRLEESTKIIAKHPDRIPIIVETSSEFILDRSKYLVPKDLSIAQFIFVLRKRIKINPEKGIFLFIGKTIPATNLSLNSIYEIHKSDDNFLYVFLKGENVFG